MRYLDKNWYLKSQKYPPDGETYEAVKALDEAEIKSGVPENLRRYLCFHDGKIISEETVQSGVEPIFSGSDYALRIQCPYKQETVTFRDAIVKTERPPTGAEWLYEEIYRHKSGKGYEIHILLESSECHIPILVSDLIEMKIVCRDISFG